MAEQSPDNKCPRCGHNVFDASVPNVQARNVQKTFLRLRDDDLVEGLQESDLHLVRQRGVPSAENPPGSAHSAAQLVRALGGAIQRFVEFEDKKLGGGRGGAAELS